MGDEPDGIGGGILSHLSGTRLLGAAGGLDGDGSNNLTEFLAGTDSTNRLSVLELLSVAEEIGDDYRIRWSSVPSKTYELKYSTDLVNWLSFSPPASGVATGTDMDFVDLSPGPVRRFYCAEAR